MICRESSVEPSFKQMISRLVVRLAFEAAERLVEVGARIVDRDDHRDERMWVVCMPFAES